MLAEDRNNFFFLISFSYLLMICSGLQASIINIPDDYPSIQDGITAAGTGDTVLVQPGTYPENIRYEGIDLVLGSLYLTTGDSTYISSTIISGSGGLECIVSFENGESGACSIIGFTIRDGLDGGISCVNSNPTIRSNHIMANISYRDGGGIYCERASPNIIGNAISSNIAGYGTGLGNGGGIYCYDNSSPLIDSNVISGNSAFGGGGISVANQSNIIIRDNMITGNHADFGGGIHLYINSGAAVTGNLITGNSSDWHGGGIYIILTPSSVERNLFASNYSGKIGGGGFINGSIVELQHNTITSNTAADSAGGFWFSYSTATMTNSIHWDNRAYRYQEIYFGGDSLGIIYSDLAFVWEGDGNIYADPLFVDPIAGDYHLQAGSPCIDAGDPDAPLDPDSTRCDMGAFCFEHYADIDEGENIPFSFELLQNHPNPFNGKTIIAYSLTEPGHVKMNIYDILGREIMPVIEKYQQAGDYNVDIDGSGLSSGVYLYRLTLNGQSVSRKMTVIK